MASAISAARTALYNLLVTAAASGSGTALAGVQVAWGDPVEYEEQEVVSLGGTADATATLATFQGDLDEAFTIIVRIKAHNPSGTADVVDARGYAMAAAVQDVVDANPKLSNSVWSAVANGGRSENGAQKASDAPGWVIFVDVNIDCVVG